MKYDASQEYMMAAEWCAKRGLVGEIGDPLPLNMGAPAINMINDDPEAFQAEVRRAAYALAMRSRGMT